MSIQGVKFGLNNLKPLSEKVEQSGQVTNNNAGNQTFADALKGAMNEVGQLQNNADQHIEGLVLKKDGISTHDAMIALEKADVAFQLMNTIRSKIIRAYEEVMRTQV